MRSHFLSTRQGKNELTDYVQELRTLIAAMQIDPLPEVVCVTVFMEGLRTGVSRTEVFRVHPSTFYEAVTVALNAEFNFKAARLGWNGYNPSSARANSTGSSANRWISAMLRMKVKLSFRLQSSNVLYDDVIRAEALDTCARGAHLVNNARLQVNTLPRARSLVCHGEMPMPSRRRAPYWGRTSFCDTSRW